MASGYATAGDAARYSVKTKKGPIRRLSARREASIVARALGGLARDALVIDIPCGAGRLLPVIRARGHRARGIDISMPMLGIARDAGAPIVCGSAFSLPLGDASVDAVVCVRLLHHYDIEDRGRILGELRRVAKERVVVTVFDAASFKHRRRLRRERTRSRPSRRGGVRVEDFLAEVRAAGLSPRRVRRLLPWYAELTFVEARVRRPRDGPR